MDRLRHLYGLESDLQLGESYAGLLPIDQTGTVDTVSSPCLAGILSFSTYLI
jgi:hypothetical protein